MLLAILGGLRLLRRGGGHRSLTALIPAGFGLVLIVLGALARREALRKHAMHAAAAVALIGCLVAAGRFFFVLFTGGNVATTAGMSTATMAVLCGAFVGLCVKSFIDARKRRKAETPDAAESVRRPACRLTSESRRSGAGRSGSAR